MTFVQGKLVPYASLDKALENVKDEDDNEDDNESQDKSDSEDKDDK